MTRWFVHKANVLSGAGMNDIQGSKGRGEGWGFVPMLLELNYSPSTFHIMSHQGEFLSLLGNYLNWVKIESHLFKTNFYGIALSFPLSLSCYFAYKRQQIFVDVKHYAKYKITLIANSDCYSYKAAVLNTVHIIMLPPHNCYTCIVPNWRQIINNSDFCI